jgi:hypothetical protein
MNRAPNQREEEDGQELVRSAKGRERYLRAKAYKRKTTATLTPCTGLLQDSAKPYHRRWVQQFGVRRARGSRRHACSRRLILKEVVP